MGFALAALASRTARASEPLSAFSEFQNLTPRELTTVQGKITDVGDQRAGIATLAFCVLDHPLDLAVFRPFYREELRYQYGGDQSKAFWFHVTPAQMQALLDRIAPLPPVVDGGVHGYLSFSLSVMKGGRPRVFETVLDTTGTRLLFERLFEAFARNGHAIEMVTQHACMLGFLPGPFPRDVSSQVSIQPQSFERDVTGLFSGRVRISNTSDQPIALPIYFVFRPPENMDVVGSSGFTCKLWPSGAPYVTLPVTRPLRPGQSLSLLLRFDNPDGDPVEILFPHLYSGPGFR